MVHGTYSRIDMSLVDRNALQRIDEAQIDDITWSDHAPITLNFVEGTSWPSYSQWKLNANLLMNSIYGNTLEDGIGNFYKTINRVR